MRQFPDSLDAAAEGAAPTSNADEHEGSAAAPVAGGDDPGHSDGSPQIGVFPAEAPRRRRVSRWVVWLSAIGLGVSIVLLIGSFVTLPYYVQGPGPTYAVEPLLDVKGAPTFKHPGELYLTTVSFRSATALRYVASLFDGDDELVSRKEVDGDLDPDEVDRLNTQLMDESKLTATMAALSHLGKDVTLTGTGALVTEVVKGKPAWDVLDAGDTIVAVDGAPVTVSSQLTDALRAKPPSSTVSLEVERDKKRFTEEVTLAPADDDPTRGVLGITVQTRDPKVDSPVDVDLVTQDIGGPSAGLAYTLAILQRLSEKDLTKGHRVVATGTMAPDGTVGPIGGIEQKVHSVEATGAEVFLVPVDNYDEARRTAKDVKVIPVANLDEALAALDSLK